MISCRGLVYLSKTSDSAVTDSAVWEAGAKVEEKVQKAYWGIIPVKEKGEKKDGAAEGITLCHRPDKVCKPNKMLWSKDCL